MTPAFMHTTGMIIFHHCVIFHHHTLIVIHLFYPTYFFKFRKVLVVKVMQAGFTSFFLSLVRCAQVIRSQLVVFIWFHFSWTSRYLAAYHHISARAAKGKQPPIYDSNHFILVLHQQPDPPLVQLLFKITNYSFLAIVNYIAIHCKN